VSNPQPGGPGPCIHVPHWHGGPVISPGTGFPFLYLLQLAGLQGRYSNLPLHRAHLPFHLMVPDPVSKSVFFGFPDTGQSPKSQ
jgi:hypothetical protein